MREDGCIPSDPWRVVSAPWPPELRRVVPWAAGAMPCVQGHLSASMGTRSALILRHLP